MTEANQKVRALFLTALMVFSVFAGTVAFAGTAAAANAGSFTVQDDSAGATTTFNASLNIQSGDSTSIGGLEVDFNNATGFDGEFPSSSDDYSVYKNGNVVQQGGSVSVSNGGNTTTITFSTIDVSTGDTITLSIDNFQNPSAISTGYTGSFQLNPSSSGNEIHATLTTGGQIAATSVTADNIDTTEAGTANITVQHPSSATDVAIGLNDSSGNEVFQQHSNAATSAPVESIDESSSTETTFVVNVTELKNIDFSLGQGTVYATAADGQNAEEPDSNTGEASTSVSLGGLEVTDFNAPRVAANGTVIEAEITVENTGSASVTQNVSFVAGPNASSAGNANLDVLNPAFQENKSVTVSGGASETVSVTVDTSNLDNASESVSHYQVAGFTQGSPYSAQTANLLVGSSTQGSATITVVDQFSNYQEGITVELYILGDYDDGPTVATAQTNENGRVTFTDLAVGGDSSNPVQYVAVAGAQDPTFESTTTTIGLYEPTQTSDSSTVTLRSALEPQNISVAAWNGESVTGNISTLLADGDVDNTATYIVYSQTQAQNSEDQPVNQDVSVDLTTSDIDPSGIDIASFVDSNGNSVDTLTVEITPNSPTTTINGETYSYTTFTVSAAQANQSSMTTSGTINPVVLNQINADAGNDVANDATDAAQVQYVLEGEEAISGEVYNRDGENIEGATVWAAYEGSNQSLEFSQETFVSDDGEPFLVTTTDADGDYVIPGLAGDNTNVTIYATAQGYNRLNLTSTSVDRFVAAEEAEQTGGPDQLFEEHNLVLTSVEVTNEYRVTLSVEGEDGTYTDATSMPIQSQRDVQVNVEVKAQNEPDSEFTPIENSSLASNVEVNFTQSGDIAVGSVLDDSLTVTESGATTTFESTRSTGTTNVTATVSNENGSTFSDTVEIEVFGVGEVTGQVINDESPADNLPGATVRLYRVAPNGTEILEQTDQTGPGGSYSFTDVRTGHDYRVVAEFDNSTGFTELSKDSAGTSNADIVIVDVAPDPADFQVSGLSPMNVTVTQGAEIDVSANVTNEGDEPATQTVEFRVGGNVVASQDVSLSGGETTTVEFTNISTSGLDAGDYTHGVYTADGEQTATLTIENSNDNGTSLTDVLNTIEAYENGNATLTDVLNAISEYES